MKRMKPGFTIICCVLLAYCSPSPEKYFAIAALNCNQLYGFAGPGMQRLLAQPSEKLVDEKTYATAPMKRMEVVENKLETLEQNYGQLKALTVNDDAREMIGASMALYEYTIPVYKTTYKELAALYDAGASPETISALEKNIHDTYSARFETMYQAVISAGTAYAGRHGIKVQQVSPAPH